MEKSKDTVYGAHRFDYIRRESCPHNCPGGKACESCRTVTLATVKWCQQREGQGIDLYFAGAKYL